MSSRRIFQLVLVLLGLFVVVTGTLDLLLGPAVVLGSVDVPVNVDSQYRYFGGLWLALGLVLLGAARQPERGHTALRVVYLAVFVGGVGRLASLLAAGTPHPLYVAFIGVEFVLPPLLLLWQNRVARPTLDGAGRPR
ncbi:DUF4345 domain-containing protein [Micromonospora sp. NPDC000018]|uniref:DUF4345 domain-containing protein n=1 Tax=Micromonospora sp. NPDC000018 TaxID=3154239 RepID=UPI00332AF9ED